MIIHAEQMGAAVLLASLIVMASLGIAVFAASSFQIWWATIPSALVSVFIACILVRTQYTLDGLILMVKRGSFIKGEALIAEVTSATPTNNPLFTPLCRSVICS